MSEMFYFLIFWFFSYILCQNYLWGFKNGILVKNTNKKYKTKYRLGKNISNKDACMDDKIFDRLREELEKFRKSPFILKKILIWAVFRLQRSKQQNLSIENFNKNDSASDLPQSSFLSVFKSHAIQKIRFISSELRNQFKKLITFLNNEDNFEPGFWMIWKNEFLKNESRNLKEVADEKWYLRYYVKSTYYRKMNRIIQLISWILYLI